MNEYLQLFFTFAQVGACTFGGGYAMLPVLQREIVDKRQWCTQEELADYFAIGQCTPGVIAVNTATFVGAKRKGALGGIVATLGMAFPSVVIITLIAAFLRNFAHIPAIKHAFNGVRAAVVALIASSVWKLGKTTLKNPPAAVIYVVVLALAVAGNLLSVPTDVWWGKLLDLLTSPVTLVALAGAAGLLIPPAKGGEQK